MWIFILISFLMILSYTASMCIKIGGIPNSISDTYYSLKHKLWFLATMWVTAGSLMPAILEMSKPNTGFLSFIACLGMALVGAAPNFKKDERKVHLAGAYLCIIGSQIWVAVNTWYFLSLWLILAAYTIIKVVKQDEGTFVYKFMSTKPMFWIEVTALASTYLAVLI